MRYVSEKELRSKKNKVIAVDELIAECKELREPWMTLDEFLRSGFTGSCWIYTNTEFVYTAYYAKDGQFYESDCTECKLDRSTIVKVVPLYKPEPPK